MGKSAKEISDERRLDRIIVYMVEDYSDRDAEVDPNQLMFRVNGEVHQIDTHGTDGFSDKLRESVMERDNNCCFICGAKGNLHVHHIIPRKIGGKHTMDNLVTLCPGCHMSIESGNMRNAIRQCVTRTNRETRRRLDAAWTDLTP